MKTKRYVILDRDGTLIIERKYLSKHNQVELIPNVVLGLKKLLDHGLRLLVLTNQSGVGRGYFSLQDLKRIHERMIHLLAKERIMLDGIYFCPHTPEDNCYCRKPKLGLIERALKEHTFDSKECFVIGDKVADIELGKAMEATTLLVRTGYGATVEKEKKVSPHYIVNDLVEAANIIQEQLKR